MKKTLLVLLNLIFITSSCKKQSYSQIAKQSENNELHNLAEITTKSKKPNDSTKQIFLNNKNENQSPIKIISSRLLLNEYSNHKDIKIIYKNVAKKDIKAIKMEWYCENSFNEPAHGKFYYVQGKSSENIIRLVKAGTTQYKVWEDFSTDANTIIKVRAYYVIFTDGTTWELTQ